MSDKLVSDPTTEQNYPSLAPQAFTIYPASELKSIRYQIGVTRETVDQITGDPVEYIYNDQTSLALGRGFSPNDVAGRPKAACINWKPEQLNPGPPSTELRLEYVRTSQQLNFVLGLDAKVEASYLTATGSAHTKVDSSFLLRQNSITVILTAKTNFGRWGMKAGATLTDLAKEWLKNPRQFEERCGSRYVSIEGRGASVSALITLDSVSTDVKLAFESEMSGSGGWGPVAGKASALFRLEASRAASQDRLSVQVFATGGAGFGALADTIKSQMVSPTGIDQATASLGNFLAQFKQENAATTYYRVSSMEDFGWDPAGIDIWSDRQETKLRVLVNEYRTTLFYLTNIKGVLDGSHPLASVMRKEDIEDLRKYVRPAEEYLDSIAINHHQCKQSHSPNDPACDLPPNRINLKGLLFLEGLDPPRANIYLHGLSPEQTKVVLSAPPSIRLTYAKRYNSAIDGFVAFFQTIGHYELSLAVVYAGTDGKEEGIYLDGPWHSGYNTVWWGTGPMQGVQFWEDWFKSWMVSRAGKRSGTVYVVIKDRMHRKFRVAFMNVNWESDGTNFANYNYEFVY